jgi:hypothetical protein
VSFFIDFESIRERIKRTWAIHALLGWHKKQQPIIPFGVTGPDVLRRPYTLYGRETRTHKWFFGRTRSGKSKAMEQYCLALAEQRIGFSVIDPHGDLATDLLWSLHDRGHITTPIDTDRFWYVDFGRKEYSIAWNLLNKPQDPYETAVSIDKAFKRMFPDLADGSAPHFENVILYSVITLIENNLPLPMLQPLLLNADYRMQLLEQVSYPDVREFFLYRFDQWGKEAANKKESTLNKVSILTLSPTFRHAFGQTDNKLQFRRIMDEGISVIFNLSRLPEDVQRFIGALLAVGFEEAAFSRADVLEDERPDYHLVEDEFHLFSAQSGVSFSKILPQTAKFHLYLLLSNQSLSQLPEGVAGALANAIKVCFRVGSYEDALYMARELWEFEENWIRREVEDHSARKHSLPDDYTVQEQYELWIKELKNLHVREAFIRVEDWTEKIKTHKVPPRIAAYQDIKNLMDAYAQALMTPIQSADAGSAAPLQEDTLSTDPQDKAEQPLLLPAGQPLLPPPPLALAATTAPALIDASVNETQENPATDVFTADPKNPLR